MTRHKTRYYFPFLISLVALYFNNPPVEQAKALSPHDLVISEIYTRGGRSDAFYEKNYVSLYHPHDEPMRLDGLAIQYSSGNDVFQVHALSGTILPQSHYLVSFNPMIGTYGAPLPLPDAQSSIEIDRFNLHIALTVDVIPLVLSTLNHDRIIDYVGIGSVTTLYGSRVPNPNGDNIAVKRRVENGVISLSKIDNSLDFSLDVATPMNSMLSLSTYLLKENNEGQCYVKYPLAKIMVNALSRSEYSATGAQLTSGQYDTFLESSDTEIVSARLRYEAWARVIGDPYPYGEPAKERATFNQEKRRSPFLMVLLFISFISLYLYKRLKNRLTY